jgi:L-alanine-DL-glutamate epimerase-like enolase superfamily enzyme
VRIEKLDVSTFEIPLEAAESDGTLSWDSTVAVTVRPTAAGHTGLGYTYGSGACATLIREHLAGIVTGSDPFDVPGTWERMVRAIRNLGRPGIASMAISAVDTALWDLKARVLEVPLFQLLGAVRDQVPVYGSGGFCSMSEEELKDQLGGWVQGQGIPRVKMKIADRWGRDPGRDVERVALAREAVGPDAEVMVDANGGYTRKQAVRVAHELESLGVTWFEEPVSSDDLEGLGEIRAMTRIDVAAGEYGYRIMDFRDLIPVVDVLQPDVGRCGGITEWARVAALCAAHSMEVSSHTAQSLSAHPACAIPNVRHAEYFADHARAERILFDGVLEPSGGALRPDPSRPGNGLELKEADVERYRRD